MSDGVNFPQLPLWEDMNFAADCDVWGNWMASRYLPNPWNKSETLGGTYVLGINLFAAASPVDFYTIAEQANLTLPEAYSGISQWFTWHTLNTWNETEGNWDTSPEFYENVIYAPFLDCTAEYCKSLGYTGNADLTGIGVYVSYYVEASLATAYLIAYTIWHLRGHAKAKRRDRDGNEALLKRPAGDDDGDKAAKKPVKISLGQRTLDSFRGSLDGFLSATMLMSIAMLIAAVWTAAAHVRAREHPKGPQTVQFFGSAVYDMVLSLLAASFSVFPVMLLYALMGRRNDDGSKLDKNKEKPRTDKHRVWLRRGVLAFMWALAATEVYLAPRGEADYDERHSAYQEADMDPCNQRGGENYWKALKASQVLIIGAPLLWLVLTAFVVTGFGIPGLAEKGWVSRWRSVWRLGIAWLNLLFMWALLAYFTVLRKRIIDTSGGIDDENQWGFGQLLALATWVPVAAEFVYIFIWGIEESLDTHMPTGFVATRVDPDLSLFHAATMGLDPFEAEDGPFMGDNKHGFQGTSVEMLPVQSAYQGGQTTPEVHITGGAQQQQQQQGAPPYYDSTFSHQQQTPWQQWNSSGW